MSIRTRCLCLIVLIVTPALLLSGCDRDPEAEARDEVGPRLVTLAPALSQMLVDLELGDRIVGATNYDYVVADGLPIVGHFQDVDTEQLLRVDPTHVLTMTTSNDPPARLREMAEAGQFELVSYPYPDTIAQVLNILHRDNDDAPSPPTLGKLLNMSRRAAQLRQRTEQQLEAVRELTAQREPAKVLLVINTNPVTASGPETVNHELLEYVGATNVAGDAKVMAPTYDREALIALSPEVILLLQPKAAPLTEGDDRLSGFADLPIPAVEHNRIHLLNDPRVLLPSTNLPQVARAMARAIHPALRDELDALVRESGEAEAPGLQAVSFTTHLPERAQ